MRQTLFAVLMLFCCFGLESSHAAAADPMQVVYFNNYPPFSWEENGRMRGILIDVLDEALTRRLGIPLKHAGYPWARAQSLVREGQADAFITIPTPERRYYTDIGEESVITAVFTIFAKADGPRLDELRHVKTLSDLSSFRLGHYIGSGWAERNLPGPQIDRAPTLDLTLSKLAVGRFDAFVDTADVVRYRIRELGLRQQIVEIPTVLDSMPFTLCIGKRSSWGHVLPKFDATIRHMREEGKIREISERYR